MVTLWNRADHYIFILSFALSFYLFFSSPNLSHHRLDVCHTSTHGAALVQISDAGLKHAARGSLKIQDTRKLPKITIWAPSHNFVRLYLCSYQSTRHTVISSHGHVVTRSTRHRSTRHGHVSSHSQLVTTEHIKNHQYQS